uniref:Uncharacterized protein n=1 Tax=Arcella intermedia TaxID=1963864 RepID=A0A6B2L5H4_9EUKA
MGFLATGPETALFNDFEDVLSLLEKCHKDHYTVINLSERPYNYPQLLDPYNYRYFGWPDHQPPPFAHLVKVVEEIHKILSQDPINVVAIHCMSGRSRTGTVIASYLLHSKIFNSPDYAIYYFNQKRSQGLSLRLPSQVRQVNNFFNFMQYARLPNGTYDLSNINNAKKFYLKSIQMSPVPSVGLSNTGYTPLIYIKDLKTGNTEYIIKSKKKYSSQKQAKLYEVMPQPILLQGDILMQFHHITYLSSLAERESELFKVYFHTSLIHTTELTYTIKDIDSMDTDDPLDFKLRDVYTDRFTLTLVLEEVFEEMAPPSVPTEVTISSNEVGTPRSNFSSPVVPKRNRQNDTPDSPSPSVNTILEEEETPQQVTNNKTDLVLPENNT